ncbi:MAG TPA: hypothetical protein VF928_08945 [Usitatibacteraceae bacterium]
MRRQPLFIAIGNRAILLQGRGTLLLCGPLLGFAASLLRRLLFLAALICRAVFGFAPMLLGHLFLLALLFSDLFPAFAFGGFILALLLGGFVFALLFSSSVLATSLLGALTLFFLTMLFFFAAAALIFPALLLATLRFLARAIRCAVGQDDAAIGSVPPVRQCPTVKRGHP